MKLLAWATHVLLVMSMGVMVDRATIAQTTGPVGTQTAKPVPKPGQMSGASFDELVDNDVAQHYYSQQAGEALKAKYDAAMARLDSSLDKAASSFSQYASLVKSSGESQNIDANVYSFLDGNNNAQIGRGTPQQIADQAETIYQMADQNAQILATLQETITPFVNEALGELDQIVSERAALINNNPAVASDVKHNATYQSNSFSDYVHNVADRALSTVSASIRADQDRMESNKVAVVQTLTKLLPLVASNTDKYGPDPKKWPPPPKGYFDTSYNATDSNVTIGSKNGAAGNGAGTVLGNGSGAAGGVSGSSTNSYSNPGATSGTGYASQSGVETDDADESIIVSRYDSATGNYTQTYTGYMRAPDGTIYYGTSTISSHDDAAPAGYNQLVTGSESGGTAGVAASTAYQSFALSSGQSIAPYTDGSDLNGGSFTSIYRGYTVVPGQNGSTVVSDASNQVQTPSSVMTVPSNQVLTGTNQVVVPSTQIVTPSPVINMPGTQVVTPSPVIDMPSTQVTMPSLCGR